MSSIAKITRVTTAGPEGGMQPCNLIDPADVISDAKPKETKGIFEETKGVDNEIGIWTCTACVEDVKSFAVNEFCILGGGEIILTDREGNREHIKTGDAFIMRQGFSGTYEVRGNLVKYFVTF